VPLERLISRAQSSGYASICLSVDGAVSGRRERDLRRGFTMPPRYTLRNVLDGAAHPRWSWGFVTSAYSSLKIANFSRDASTPHRMATLSELARDVTTPAGTWDDLRRVRDLWEGTLSVKGIMSAEDAAQAVDAGADLLIVSNHGGRQLESLPASLEVLPEVVAAVGDRAEVLLDGGVRRGTHIAKALALGARACLIARPYLYGLAVAGQHGVERAVEMLTDELDRCLALLGRPTVQDLDRTVLRESTGRIW
jgi:isopentenyl diphosphate isomerase/L-lactate dehydrogenase-like FMN-dependent dehydrogenase